MAYRENLEKARKATLDRQNEFSQPEAKQRVQDQTEGLMRRSSYDDQSQAAQGQGGFAQGMGMAIMEQLENDKKQRLAKEDAKSKQLESNYMSGSSTVPDSETAGRIRSKLMDRGMPSHVADAFIVNFQDESGLNSGINEANPIVEGSRGGFGFYQLTGPRRTAYEAFAKKRGVRPSDEDAQLDWLMMELKGSEKKAGNAIYKTSNTSDAAVAIVNQFLRPAKEHAVSRSARYRNL